MNAADEDGVTALSRAVQKKHLEIIQALLAHPKIEVNQADKHGVTPLMKAADTSLECWARNYLIF